MLFCSSSYGLQHAYSTSRSIAVQVFDANGQPVAPRQLNLLEVGVEFVQHARALLLLPLESVRHPARQLCARGRDVLLCCMAVWLCARRWSCPNPA